LKLKSFWTPFKNKKLLKFRQFKVKFKNHRFENEVILELFFWACEIELN
jgi:hypothetical protein